MFLALGALAAPLIHFAHGLEVSFIEEFNGYTVSHKGTDLFKSESGIAVFCDGQWYSKGHGLVLQEFITVHGEDPVLGSYTGMQLEFLAGDSTPFIATAKSYESGLDVVFQSLFPNGANATSAVAAGSGTHDDVIVNFPTFDTIALDGTLSWEGSFVSAVQGHSSKGPVGGPTVFFDGATLVNTVMAGPLDNFKAWSAGTGQSFANTSAWAPGPSTTLTKLPPGFTQSTLLHVGQEQGITGCIYEWGQVLQQLHETVKAPDVTLEKIGYQTDNGAYYVFCKGNCSKTMIDVISYYEENKLPMGYLSFQGSGASSSKVDPSLLVKDTVGQAAPWCVNTWGPDGTGPNYPLGVGKMQEALGVPLQLYAPYFCEGSQYFNDTQWTPVHSDTTLPACGQWAFQNVEPSQSRDFYDWFFAKGTAVGMVSFEPDFLNQNYNCIPDFIENYGHAEMWMRGMADAALAAKVAVQWCYATPTDVLATLDMPAVTNFRTSFDFCYGNSWNFGVSNLLVWTLGAYPSKDTLWTTDNGRFEVPGCNWTPDHETPAAELHVVLAIMSTGPVGISDMIGGTNLDLIARVVSMDGTLLKPSKAITAIDSQLAAGSSLSALEGPNGHVWTTFSGSVEAVNAWYVVSFQMTAEFLVSRADIWPRPAVTQKLVIREFHAAACVNQSQASGCVNFVMDPSTAVFLTPVSDQSNTTGGTDFAPAVTMIWPMCGSGYALLGDLTKYVAVSSTRFPRVVCTDMGIELDVVGTSGEVVAVTLLEHNKVLVVAVELPVSGKLALAFP